MPQVPSRDEVQTLLSALLITRKEAFTSGVPVALLDQDYRAQEGTRIPFRQLGYACLLDFLQSLNGGMCVKHKNGSYYAYPLVTEKSRHVSQLVAGQNSKRTSHSGRRVFRSSPCYPRLPPPSMRLDSSTMAEIVSMVKASQTEGVHKNRVLEYARYRLNCDVDAYDLGRQLREVSHEIVIEGDMVYPASRYMSLPRDSWANDYSQRQPPQDAIENGRLCNARPAGHSDSEDEDGDDEEFAIASVDGNDIHQTTRRDEDIATREEQPPNYEDTRQVEETEEQTRREENESIAVLISERTRFRLKKLIEKHPEGIWCAELPALYQQAYTIPLNYEELGFGSVIDYAAHLPEIFHYARPRDKGDFKLFDAQATKPNIKTSDRPKVPSLASLHNIYEQYVEPTEPVPSVLCQSTVDKLIPDGVMTIGETVAQICVTEVVRGIHDYIDVIVSDVFTPSFFWIQFLKRMPKFNIFMNELHEFYETHASKYTLPLAVMEKGMNCACMYDGKWHRGIVKKIRPDSYVTVMFYDYGTVKSYQPECIHFLHRSFSNLPAQAVPCGLYNLKPTTGTRWSRSVACEFVARATNVPLVATVASMDTDNNSMMVCLTNTEEKEDFHINDWMVQNGLAIYGKMGETVDMNDAPYDQPMDPSFYGPTQQQQQQQPGQQMLSAIVEEDESQLLSSLTLARNSAEHTLEIERHMNDCMRLSMRRLKSDLEIHAKNNYAVNAEVVEDFKDLMKVLRTSRLWDNEILPNFQNSSNARHSTPEFTDANARTNVEVETSGEKKSSTCIVDENSNEPGETHSHCTSSTGNIETLPKCNGNLEPLRSTPNSEKTPNVNAATNLFSKSLDGTREPPPLPQKKPPALPPRQKFEDSLADCAKNFYGRIVARSIVEKCRESPLVQLPETNPFRYDVSAMASPETTESPPRKYHETMKLAGGRLEPQMPCHYESPPVMYDKNQNEATSWNEKNHQIYQIVREREKLVRSKGMNVESWLNYSSDAPAVNGATTTCEVASSRGQASDGAAYHSPRTATPLEWSQAIEDSIGFVQNGNAFQSSDESRVNGDDATRRDAEPTRPAETARENPSRRENSVGNEATPRHTLEELGPRNWDIRKTQITNRYVFLIIYKSQGWIAFEEFASAFTNNSPDTVLKILTIQRVDIPFLRIGRSDNSSMFKELDRSSIGIPRDISGKIADAIDLVPLKSSLRILRKLNMFERDEVMRATRERIFPENSTVLFDLFTLINTWGHIEQASQFA